MKQITAIAAILLFASCSNKTKSKWECQCSNGYTKTISAEYKIASQLCIDKENEINAKAPNSTECILN